MSDANVGEIRTQAFEEAAKISVFIYSLVEFREIYPKQGNAQ